MSLFKKYKIVNGERVLASPYWWMDVAPLDGPRIRKSTKVRHDAPDAEQRKKNRKLAEYHLHELYTEQAEVRAGKRPKTPISVSKYLDWYQAYKTTHKRSHAREVSALKHLRNYFGTFALAGVTAEDVQEYMTDRRKTVTASTVNRELDVLKHVFASAVPKYLTASPIAGLSRLRTVKRETATLSRTDEAKLLAVLEPADQAVILAALDTLIRAGSLLRLQWFHDHGTHFVVENPKSGQTYKPPISDRLRVALDRLPKPSRTARIFGDRSVQDLQRMLQAGCLKAGILYGRQQRGITFHGLRHTGATRVVEAGKSLRVLQELGDWHDLRLVQRYTHPATSELRDAVNAIGGVPSGVPETRDNARDRKTRQASRYARNTQKTGRKSHKIG